MTRHSESPPLELLRAVTSGYLDRDLQPSEVASLTHAITDHLLPIVQNERNVFILGSYEDGYHWKLKAVKDELNQLFREGSNAGCYPFLMEDIPGTDIWINAEIKFRLLADIADCIVGVVEHDQGGFVFEQGVISSTKRYRQKTYLLKYEYDTEEEERANYSFMQSNGIFQKFEEQGRLETWSTNQELFDTCEPVFRHLLSQ